MSMITSVDVRNVIRKRIIAEHIGYKEIDSIDYFEIRLWLECANAENAAMKANQQAGAFYAREGIKRV